MSKATSQSVGQSGPVSAKTASDQLRFTNEQFIWRFSPNQTDPELLEAIFVGRESLLQNVLEKITESATTGSKHHVLLYGPRGIGKSHLTSLLHYRMSRDESLSEKIHVARLNEDETTTSMVQLLVRIYRSLCSSYADEYSAAWLDELLDQSPEEITGVLTRRLVARFENRTLIVLVENLNLLFENLGTKGQHELRTLLQEHPFACLIATSQQLFKAVTDRSQPFFGFFQQIPLKPLTLDYAQQLLLNIAQTKGQDDLAAFLNTPDGRGRVRAIHDLAGGNHRVYIVLSGFITRESLDQLVAPFQKMADELTPYYQERLRWISPQQRQIVELLCREHGTLNPKEIARRLLVTERSIGKQVRKLAEIGYLNSTKRGRETFYELSEPLMRLAYEVKEQSLLEMLIDFLRIWYRPEQMRQLQASGLCHSTQAYIDAAYERSQTHPDPRLKILQGEIEKAEAEGRSHELATLWEEKAAASNTALDWITASYCFGTIDKDFDHALNCCEMALELDPKYAGGWNNKGNSLYSLGRYDEALSCYEKAIELDLEYVYAWTGKGNMLYNSGRFLEALSCYEKAIENDPEYIYAWSNKGLSLNSLGRFLEALSCYERAIEINPRDSHVWNDKGIALYNLDRFEDAISCYKKAIEFDPETVDPRFNQSEALFAMYRWQEGFESLRNAFKLFERLPECLGDVDSMWSLIFGRSDDDTALRARISSLVDIYEQASRPDQGAERRSSGNEDSADQDETAGTALRSVRPTNQPPVNPLAYLGDGLVRSLAKIDADRVTPAVLESYVQAVEQRVTDLPEFEVPLRLFRYGVRYLISKDDAEFVKLIQPERRILRQALHLSEET